MDRSRPREMTTAPSSAPSSSFATSPSPGSCKNSWCKPRKWRPSGGWIKAGRFHQRPSAVAGICAPLASAYTFEQRVLRNASQPLQGRKHTGATSQTELALELVDAEPALTPFPL